MYRRQALKSPMQALSGDTARQARSEMHACTQPSSRAPAGARAMTRRTARAAVARRCGRGVRSEGSAISKRNLRSGEHSRRVAPALPA